MKNWLYQKRKKFKLWLDLRSRKAKRRSLKTTLTKDESFNIPIIINNFNRLTYLKMMVDQLQSFGYKNIYVLDNDSTYPPLLEYYKTISAKVVYLKKNFGYMALWQSNVFDQFKDNYYVYSDPDILLQDDCPYDFVYQLYVSLSQFRQKEKAGVALKIDNLPDNRQKALILKWETGNWKKVLSENVYDAPVDTTLALYKPLAFGNAEECEAIRVGGKLIAQHLPWYIDPENLSDEDLYYKNHANSSSYWADK